VRLTNIILPRAVLRKISDRARRFPAPHSDPLPHAWRDVLPAAGPYRACRQVNWRKRRLRKPGTKKSWSRQQAEDSCPGQPGACGFGRLR
jgi:hypothetical protein